MNETDKPRRYFIISLDGGGVRCALQVTLLKRIFTKFPALEQRVCLVAGTSAGALVGAVFSALGVEKMLEHMSTQDFAKKIFAESWAHEVRSMKGLYRANYVNRELAKLLQIVFGPEILLDHYKKTANKSDLLITSFRIDTTKESSCKQCVSTAPATTQPVIDSKDIELKEVKKDIEVKEINEEKKEEVKQDVQIKVEVKEEKKEEESRWTRLANMLRWRTTAAASTIATQVDATKEQASLSTSNAIIQEAYKQQKQHQITHKCNCLAWHAQLSHTFVDCDKRFVDVLLQTTAAPTYFPAHQGCVDGGVIAQNPSLLATTFAMKYGRINGRVVNIEDIVVLSIGSGSHPMNMNSYGASADLGLAQWVPNLMSLFNDASLDATEIGCRNLLGGNYIRLQIKMPRDIDLANYNEWNELVKWAESEDLTELFEKLATLL